MIDNMLDVGPVNHIRRSLGKEWPRSSMAVAHICCDKTDMNKPFLIKNIKQRKLKQIRNDPIMTHITPKQTSMSIGPGDQSEEVCPSVTIDRHQAEGDTRKRIAETHLHPCTDPRSHGTNSRTLSPRE